MAKAKGRLGRRLEDMLSTSLQGSGASSEPVSSFQQSDLGEDDSYGKIMKGKPIYDIALDQIDPNPFQPRLTFEEEEIAGLADNIQKHGLLQPIIVRKKNGRYQLITGERRFRAFQKNGESVIPAYILAVDDRLMAELALSENLQRKDLNPIEKAIAFRNYLETYDCGQDELGKRLGLDRSTISNMIRLLDLPEKLQKAVCTGDLTQGHARALLPLGEADQFKVAGRIQSQGWSVRQTEDYVRNLLNGTLPPEENENTGDQDRSQSEAHLADLLQQFRSALGPNVRLTRNERGSGKLVIPFKDSQEFERIYQFFLPRR
ncbi:MAG: ParB/RepB/Spo0J family partition protein [Thermoguttaceae bacterium]|nr:ParB/RepB/Spo0J family partition protein [Thermoguttaceae bacterium]